MRKGYALALLAVFALVLGGPAGCCQKYYDQCKMYMEQAKASADRAAAWVVKAEAAAQDAKVPVPRASAAANKAEAAAARAEERQKSAVPWLNRIRAIRRLSTTREPSNARRPKRPKKQCNSSVVIWGLCPGFKEEGVDWAQSPPHLLSFWG